MEHERTIDRRRAIQAMGVMGLAGLSGLTVAAPGSTGIPARAPSTGPSAAEARRSLRVAHLTDLHIQPERDAVAGVAACLRHVQSLDDPPDLILGGGDHIMDSFETDLSRARQQWELLRKVMKDENSLAFHPCIGNHDIWGWHKPKSATAGDEPGWGKALCMDQLEMDRPYSSFNRGGWHFVVLDSVRHDPDDPNGYVGGLDDEQFEWLSADLESHQAMNTLLLTHIPILSASTLDRKREPGGDMKIGGGLLFIDWPRVKGLLNRNPQVRCVAGGHMHRIDRVEFQGVTHLCNGAVSGNWWKGAHHEASEGYAVIDLY
ncbi:MAG TPA: metallophosphoesterase, partial [Phycisphaerales bacterium]|nr:metallophosphoesterase [Phycisphaerales bacterium]